MKNPNVLTLAEVLSDYPNGIGILTNGQNFTMNEMTNIGSSGWWKCSAERVRALAGVAVCVREDRTSRKAIIHVGTIIDVDVDMNGRVRVTFRRDRRIVMDDVVWNVFAGGFNPVRYVKDECNESKPPHRL